MLIISKWVRIAKRNILIISVFAKTTSANKTFLKSISFVYIRHNLSKLTSTCQLKLTFFLNIKNYKNGGKNKKYTACIPFFCTVNLTMAENQALAGSEDNSCLRSRHWAKEIIGTRNPVHITCPPQIICWDCCVNPLTSKSPHKVIEGFE